MNELKRGIVYLLHTASIEELKNTAPTWGEGENYFSKILENIADHVFEFIKKEETWPDIIIYKDEFAYKIVSLHLDRFKGMFQEKLTQRGIALKVISASPCGSIEGVLSIVQTIYPDYSEKEFLENISALYTQQNLPTTTMQHEYLVYRLEKSTSVFIN